MPLKSWITNWVQDLPQLNKVLRLGTQDSSHHCEAKDPDADTALHITTFTNGIDTLFHFRQQTQYLYPAAVEGFEQWYGPVVANRSTMPLSNAMAFYLQQDNMTPLPAGSRGTAAASLKVPNREDEALEDGYCNMTSYCEYALPHNLLKEIYQESGHSWGWKTGTRGLPLPAHVWVSLQSWKSALDATNPII